MSNYSRNFTTVATLWNYLEILTSFNKFCRPPQGSKIYFSSVINCSKAVSNYYKYCKNYYASRSSILLVELRSEYNWFVLFILTGALRGPDIRTTSVIPLRPPNIGADLQTLLHIQFPYLSPMFGVCPTSKVWRSASKVWRSCTHP